MLRFSFSLSLIVLFTLALAKPAEAGGQTGPKEAPKEKASTPSKAGRQVENSVYLGIFTVPLRSISNRVKERLLLKDDEGVVIVEVLPESPAVEAGLREKDVITHVNGNTIGDQAALCTELNRLGAGKKVSVSILRLGERQTVIARLKETSVEVITFLPYAKPNSGGVSKGSSSDVAQQRIRRIQELEREVARLEKKLRDLEEAQLAKKP